MDAESTAEDAHDRARYERELIGAFAALGSARPPAIADETVEDERANWQRLQDAVAGVRQAVKRHNDETAIFGPIGLALFEDWVADEIASELLLDEKLAEARREW